MGDAKRQLNSFHCFAGAGGGILADVALGHRIVGACEIEEYPRRVLFENQRRKILQPFPIWDDIKTLDGKQWRGCVDILCGGFPCQDISTAGNGKGAIKGERSILWTEMLRVASEMGCPYLFLENSPQLLRKGLYFILGAFAEMGYNARWGVWSSAEMGACHVRERLWLFAYRSSERGQRCTTQPIQPEREMQTLENGGRVEIERIRRHLSPPELCRGRNGVANLMDRLKVIGNGQDPRTAARAFRQLSDGII